MDEDPRQESTHGVHPSEQERILRFASLNEGAVFAGRYRVIERIGAGGTGEVYRAHDSLSDETCALKVLFPSPDGASGSLARLRRELQLVRSLNHPGIIKVYDIGECDGLLFLVMELMVGETLRDRLHRERKLPTKTVVKVVKGVLEALAASHNAGIIHRDIKPANIFLVSKPGTADPETSTDSVVLLDFGLARPAGNPTLTITGKTLGTPHYMAPEQMRGGDVGPATDLFSCGVVLWEMLLGTMPFPTEEGWQTVSTGRRTKVRAPIGAFRGVSNWLKDLALWLLSPNPQYRPANAAAALDFLRRKKRRKWIHRVRARWFPNQAIGTVGSWMHAISRWTLVTTAILLTLGVLFVPVVLVPSEEAVARRSLAGIPLGQIDVSIPRPYTPYLTRLYPEKIWDRNYLALLPLPWQDDADPRASSTGLAKINSLTGRVTPFALTSRNWRDGPPQAYANYDRRFHGKSLFVHPWRPTQGETKFVAVYQYPNHYSTVMAIFDSLGSTSMTVFHPGDISDQKLTRIDGTDDPSNPPLFVFSGVNNHLGGRPVFFGIGPKTRDSFIVAPPFKGEESARSWPSFYTFLSDYEIGGPTLVEEGGGIRVTLDSGRAFSLDRRGVPLEDWARDGIDPTQWSESQTALLRLLLNTSQQAAWGNDLEAAQGLEEFAQREAETSSAQRGVALARAAELRMSGDDWRRALLNIETAIDLEPQLAGHYRILVHILSWRDRWEEARDRISLHSGTSDNQREPGSLIDQRELLRDLIVGALITGRGQAAEEIYGIYVDSLMQSYYPAFCGALLQLHRGRPDRAIESLDLDPTATRDSAFAFVRATALTMTNPPRPAEAREYLEIARSGLGHGQVLPYEFLQARIDRLEGLAPPSSEELEAALDRQCVAARTNIVDWYFLTVAQEIAEELGMTPECRRGRTSDAA